MQEITISLEVYSLDIIYAAAYVMLEKNYVVLRKGEENNILVRITPKEGSDERIEERFHEQLLNYSVYKEISAKNKDIRELIVGTAINTIAQNGRQDKPL